MTTREQAKDKNNNMRENPPELKKYSYLWYLKANYILWAIYLFLSIKLYLKQLRLFVYVSSVAAVRLRQQNCMVETETL